ncbi:hypothetical protein G6F64_005031 [Rhizopus arrhizus]|uniref:DNA mismatch repair protein S5 domain-containing protein n=1 Tax=Rhizopus oryzae TaxID=64495 RepID=A0A9P6XBD1_RHIOR|nr:hypothetical protein G6F64_005031 [Rhizopus arrhizus]
MRISKLDPSVIKRIAAGETIQRPVNVIKEMMENSLDAGSKHIDISVTKGGFDMIKVKDDGHGIQIDDLSIICERHTTSKMKTFSDLNQLSTFGFRGEALASISNVSNISIVSKTKDALCGYQANYKDGKLLDKPRPCASNSGTMMIVQGLFQNMPQRRKALKSGQEEYGHIQTCVQNYAIHYYQLGFILKKEDVVDLNYPPVQAQIDRIQRVLGKFVASHVKRTEYCHKRQFYKVYADMKTNYKPPFLYVSLRIDPSHVDVNVHPTKKELYLLNEQDIIHDLCQLLHDSIHLPLLKDKQENRDRVPQAKATLDYYFNKMSRKGVRNHQSTPLTSQQEVPKNTSEAHRPQRHGKNSKPRNWIETSKTMVSGSREGSVRGLNKASEDDDIDLVPILEKAVDEDFKRIDLIQREINKAKDKNLSRLLTGHELIEYVDSNLVVSVYNDRYYLMNPSVISEEFFYQVILHQFGQFGLLTLSEPVSLRACFCLMTQSEQELGQLQNAVISQRDILNHQFRFSVTLDGQLESLPMLIKNYVPSVERLPLLLYNMATKVHWELEVDRLKELAREFALFYSIDSKMQWEQVVGLLHQNLFQVPNYMANSGYLIELDFPPSFINSHLV